MHLFWTRDLFIYLFFCSFIFFSHVGMRFETLTTYDGLNLILDLLFKWNEMPIFFNLLRQSFWNGNFRNKLLVVQLSYLENNNNNNGKTLIFTSFFFFFSKEVRSYLFKAVVYPILNDIGETLELPLFNKQRRWT